MGKTILDFVLKIISKLKIDPKTLEACKDGQVQKRYLYVFLVVKLYFVYEMYKTVRWYK